MYHFFYVCLILLDFSSFRKIFFVRYILSVDTNFCSLLVSVSFKLYYLDRKENEKINLVIIFPKSVVLILVFLYCIRSVSRKFTLFKVFHLLFKHTCFNETLNAQFKVSVCIRFTDLKAAILFICWTFFITLEPSSSV